MAVTSLIFAASLLKPKSTVVLHDRENQLIRAWSAAPTCNQSLSLSLSHTHTHTLSFSVSLCFSHSLTFFVFLSVPLSPEWKRMRKISSKLNSRGQTAFGVRYFSSLSFPKLPRTEKCEWCDTTTWKSPSTPRHTTPHHATPRHTTPRARSLSQCLSKIAPRKIYL